MSFSRFRVVLFFVLLAGFAAGCADLQDPTRDWSAQRFYTEGKEALAKGDWMTAIKHFESLEARYPYGPYAEQAQLEIAYAYYKDDDSASAIAAADRFIRLHPTHPHVDYAYYLKGLANFNEQDRLLDRLTGRSDLTDRDPKAPRDAYDAFRELTTRYPQSRYAADAKARMGRLVDVLARNEVNVADYYFRRGAYVAAVNRSKYVIEHYQRTRAVEDALGIQAKAYEKMGLETLKSDTLRVLKKNFPDSRYLAELGATQSKD
jgi:outer membrane protein assembly factor BamD